MEATDDLSEQLRLVASELKSSKEIMVEADRKFHASYSDLYEKIVRHIKQYKSEERADKIRTEARKAGGELRKIRTFEISAFGSAVSTLLALDLAVGSIQLRTIDGLMRSIGAERSYSIDRDLAEAIAVGSVIISLQNATTISIDSGRIFIEEFYDGSVHTERIGLVEAAKTEAWDQFRKKAITALQQALRISVEELEPVTKVLSILERLKKTMQDVEQKYQGRSDVDDLFEFSDRCKTVVSALGFVNDTNHNEIMALIKGLDASATTH